MCSLLKAWRKGQEITWGWSILRVFLLENAASHLCRGLTLPQIWGS